MVVALLGRVCRLVWVCYDCGFGVGWFSAVNVGYLVWCLWLYVYCLPWLVFAFYLVCLIYCEGFGSLLGFCSLVKLVSGVGLLCVVVLMFGWFWLVLIVTLLCLICVVCIRLFAPLFVFVYLAVAGFCDWFVICGCRLFVDPVRICLISFVVHLVLVGVPMVGGWLRCWLGLVVVWVVC